MNNLSVSTQSASLGQSTPARLPIDKLIDGISEITQSANPVEWPRLLAQLLQKCQWEQELIQAHAQFTQAPDKYWYKTLARTDKFEVNLCCWSRHQATRIHYHPGSYGAFNVLSGIVIEERFSRISESQSQRILVRRSEIAALPEKAIGLITPETIHRVHCGSDFAVSLHVYLPPLADSEQPLYKVIDDE